VGEEEVDSKMARKFQSADFDIGDEAIEEAKKRKRAKEQRDKKGVAKKGVGGGGGLEDGQEVSECIL
jgi:hypothetical protein